MDVQAEVDARLDRLVESFDQHVGPYYRTLKSGKRVLVKPHKRVMPGGGGGAAPKASTRVSTPVSVETVSAQIAGIPAGGTAKIHGVPVSRDAKGNIRVGTRNSTLGASTHKVPKGAAQSLLRMSAASRGRDSIGGTKSYRANAADFKAAREGGRNRRSTGTSGASAERSRAKKATEAAMRRALDAHNGR